MNPFTSYLCGNSYWKTPNRSKTPQFSETCSLASPLANRSSPCYKAINRFDTLARQQRRHLRVSTSRFSIFLTARNRRNVTDRCVPRWTPSCARPVANHRFGRQTLAKGMRTSGQTRRRTVYNLGTMRTRKLRSGGGTRGGAPSRVWERWPGCKKIIDRPRKRRAVLCPGRGYP
jgi:hypothetical protein